MPRTRVVAAVVAFAIAAGCATDSPTTPTPPGAAPAFALTGTIRNLRSLTTSTCRCDDYIDHRFTSGLVCL